MPEQTGPERKLPGETTITSSSDEAIEATIAGIGREIQGLSGSEDVAEADLLPPITNISSLKTGGVKPTGPVSIEGQLRQLRPSDSALALLIARKRKQRKAA